MAFFYKLIFSG
jgi:hypothetical protein